MSPILVSQRLVRQESYGEIRACLDEAWGVFFDGAGAFPIPLISSTPTKPLWDNIKPAALILTGGNDLSCFSDDPLSRMRDDLEKSHLEEAIVRNIPVLGICRGAQFIAHYFKSTLKSVSGHVATRHSIAVDSPSSFGSLGESGRIVNSYHSYGITELGADLGPLAQAPDGTIEAFEHKRYPILGLMWHPEREEPALREMERSVLATMISNED